jgi:hypothetical protein
MRGLAPKEAVYIYEYPQKIHLYDPTHGISYEPLEQYLKDIP